MDNHRRIQGEPPQGACNAAKRGDDGAWYIANDWLQQHPTHRARFDAEDVLAVNPDCEVAKEVLREYQAVQASIRQWQPYGAAECACRLGEAVERMRSTNAV